MKTTSTAIQVRGAIQGWQEQLGVTALAFEEQVGPIHLDAAEVVQGVRLAEHGKAPDRPRTLSGLGRVPHRRVPRHPDTHLSRALRRRPSVAVLAQVHALEFDVRFYGSKW